MRILTIAVLLGSAILAANPLSQDTQTGSQASSGNKTVVSAGKEIDPVVTGQTLSKEDISQWEEKRKRYLECPECESKQPFPGE